MISNSRFRFEDALNYKINSIKIMNEFLDKDSGGKYILKFLNKNDKCYLELYLNGIKKFRAEYEYIGFFNIILSTWYWSWGIALINSNCYNKIKNLAKMPREIIENYNKFDEKEAEFLNYIFKNNNFYISYKKIELILNIVLYFCSGLFILPYRMKNSEIDKINYFLIKKIIKIY